MITITENTSNKRIGPHYVCTGISSKVKIESTKDQFFEPKDLHVIQLDIDDMDQNPANTAIMDDLPDGIYLVTQTDQSSWNVTSLTCYPRSKVIQAKANVSVDDAQHLKIGIQRDYWILRLSGKGSRDRPQFRSLVHNYDKDLSQRQMEQMTLSKPHVELYDKLYREYDIRSLLPAIPVTGDKTSKEKYVTRVE